MPVLPVAGYYRVSVARDDMHAPELYESEIARYCAYKGFTLGAVYKDIDHSAFRGARPRPSLEALIAERKNYSAVIVPKLSRFGRSMKELIKLFDVFDSDDIPLVFLDMDLDTSTSQGRLLRHILAAFAEYESDVKGDYARANHRRIAEAGRPSGPAPFGYRMVGTGSGRTLEIDDERAPIVVEMFERYADRREGFSHIAIELNLRGDFGSRGGRWSRGRVRYVLDNPAYVGLRRLEGETFKASWPAIIDRELWERSRAVRQERRQPRQRRRQRQRGLLSGLLVCGSCERPMAWHPRYADKRYECQTHRDDEGRCRGGSMRGERAEGLVIDAIHQLFALATSPTMTARAQQWRDQWRDSSAAARRPLLAHVIERVIVALRPRSDRGSGRRGRTIKVEWAPEWSVAVFNYVGASSTLSFGRTKILTAEGKTWAQWQRELRAAR